MNNNIWNAKQAGTQKLEVWGPGNWRTTSDHSRTDVPPGAIKSYPCTQRNFKDRMIASFTEVTARYDATCPPVGEWNAAFDIWLGAWGAIKGELMVWTDHRYNGPLPPKNATESTTVTIDGQGYIAWRRPLNKDDPRWYIALAMTPMRAAGEVDLLAIFKWLVEKGWLKGTDLIAAIEFGIEQANTITPTGGPQVFWLNDYELTAR